MSAKVVKLNVVKRQLAELGNLSDIDADYTKAVRAFVNSEVRDYMRKGGRLNSLALKAGRNVHTISRLAYYETTRPQWTTIMSVIIALEAFRRFSELTARYAKAHAS